MAEYLIQEETLTEIADTIREKCEYCYQRKTEQRCLSKEQSKVIEV